ncbi:hypothetical protein BKA62DRAFT_776649 [Auriculariales sp. MPI-PUGE-AT-0066]|nr:hypothetical protein BKA62DRAFT_776649 [Auriculariales sp. MPI-PUGE-AT-0066]
MGRVDRFISGSSTAGLIQTWSLGIAELGAMLKIDKGVAQLVLDPARCLELSNAKPDIVVCSRDSCIVLLIIFQDLSKLNPSTTKVVYDGFKIVLEGMANMTDGAPWPWKAIPQTILQFAKLVERSLDIPDKIHDLIRMMSQRIAILCNVRKEDASPHQSELTSFGHATHNHPMRIVEKTHPAKAFLLTDRVNAIIQDESARMQEALINLQTRFMAYTAYTVESILKCVIRIQSTVDNARTEFKLAKLPARPTFFYGRDDSVNIIVELICTSTGARIAIMGSGGIGKTSLSLIVIYDERVVGVVGDSRYFVSVEGASDVGAAAQLLAGQLGLPNPPIPSQRRSRSCNLPCALLIVDNLETLLFTENAAAQKETERMLQRLAGIPTLTLVITSRGAVPPNGIRWSYAPSAGLEAISLPAARDVRGNCRTTRARIRV